MAFIPMVYGGGAQIHSILMEAHGIIQTTVHICTADCIKRGE